MLGRMSSTMRTLLIAGVGLFVGAAATNACGLDLVGRSTATTDELDAGEARSDAGGDDTGDDDTDSSIPIDADVPVDASEDVVVDSGNDAGDPYTTRVTAGLVALYDFEEGIAGEGTVHDRTADPLDLTLNNRGRAQWGTHTLTITDYNIATSYPLPFTKGRTAMTASGEFSLEAWIEYAGQDAEFGRIVESSASSDDRNYTLGTRSARPWSSLRTSESVEAKAKLDNALHHLVSTRNTVGELRLYVDGVLASGPTSTQAFTNWGDYPLHIANTGTFVRGWKGTFHLVAIYARALPDAEIQQNFRAGADPR